MDANDADASELSVGAVTGDKGNVKFRFDDTYMKMAAEQKL